MLQGFRRGPLPPLALVLLCHHGLALALSPQDVFTRVSPSVAQLEVLDAQGAVLRAASATQIAGLRFVAVCDTLEPEGTLRLTLGARTAPARVAARDRLRHLCFVEAAGLDGPALPPVAELPAAGSRVYAVSNALGLGIGISEGVVAGLRSAAGGSVVQFTASVSPGSEGGALVDEQGRMVGVLDYRRRDGQNVNFALPVMWLAEVDARSAAAGAQLKRVDAAAALRKAGQWPALSDAVAAWLRDSPDDPDAWRFALEAAEGRKDAAGALKAWTERARLEPDDLQVGLGYGEALLRQKDADAALAQGKALVAAHPAEGRSHDLMARALRSKGALRDAEASFRAAIERDAFLVGAYHGLAEMALARGDTATALSIWSRLSGLLPAEGWPQFGLVQAYLGMGQAERADAVLQRLPASAADGAEAWYWRGRVLLRMREPEAAAAAFQRSIDGKTTEPDWAWSGLASALWSLKRHPEAIAAAREAVRLNPGRDDWQFLLAAVLNDGGHPAEARGVVGALTQRTPGNAAYWRLQGNVLTSSGQMDEAVKALEKSLLIDPQQRDAWATLIQVQQYLGRRKEARDAYQRLALLDARAAEASYRQAILPYEGQAGVAR